MAENDRWYDQRDERAARTGPAWRDEDRRPYNPDLDRDRGYAADDGRRLYGAGDYERERRGDYPRAGDYDRGPNRDYAAQDRGHWPSYDPGRDSPDLRDRSGVDWRGEAGPAGQREPWRDETGRYARPRDWRDENERDRTLRGREDERIAQERNPGREERNPWFGEEPGRREARYEGRPEGRPEGRSFWDRARDEAAALFGGGGEHRGRGPKGYRRSDDRIREDVSDRLTDDPWLDASEIEVKVHNAEVTLEGRVRSRDDKRRAEDLAERVSGVAHVQNNIRFRETPRSDETMYPLP